jgi:hypothetical protein
MALMDKLFGRKKSIKDLSTTDLQTEKIRLEEQERRVNKTLEKLEGDKSKLFRQGASEASKRQKVILARKIKELDEESKIQDRKSAMLSKQIRVVNRLVSMKRKESELREAGLWSTISEMDPVALETMLTEGKVTDEMEAGKVHQILDILETETDMSESLDEDADTMKLVALMEQAGESGAIEEKLAEAEGVLKRSEEEIEEV